jgi:tRNA G10  N-methylase Trm11
MDSTDRVYIYQTERKHIEVRINIGHSTSPDYITYDGNEIDGDSVIYDFNYPNYIGLKPEFLLAIETKDFLSFIKLNNDIFQLDTSKSEKMMLFYIASNQDTVKNEAFYDLTTFITRSRNQINSIHYFVRKTTEEENAVIKCKRENTEFEPETFNWTEKFLDGKSSPFSKQYKQIELKAYSLIMAIETIKKNSLETRPLK